MKNILIISKSSSLEAEFKKTGIFKSVGTSASLIGRALGKIDILIVDDKTVSYREYIKNFSTLLKQVKSNYYIVGDPDTYSTVDKALSSYGVIVIPPLLTVVQICKRVCSLAADDFSQENSTVCFFGSGPGAGASMVSQSVAKLISDSSGKSIGFLNLDGSGGGDYIDTDLESKGLAEIKERLINNILSAEELKNSCIKSSNLYFLPGEEEISKVRYYQPEHIEKLVELCSETFDVVILNGGSAVTGMSIGALNSSKLKFLVTTQSDKYFRNYFRMQKQIFSNLGINPEDFSLVVNKYVDSEKLESEIVLAKKYGMVLASVITLLEYVPALEAEKRRNTLMEHDREYASSIEQLTVSVCAELEIDILNTGKNGNRRGNFFKTIFRKV